MSEYDALARGIHAKAEEAKAAASRTAVYKETLSKAVAQYEKKYGVKLGDPENLDLAALKVALLQEKASLGDEANKLADRFNEIKNKDYAAEEERNLQASKTQVGIHEDADEMSLDDPVEESNAPTEDATTEATPTEAAPTSSIQGIASAVAQQSANAEYPDYEDYNEQDYDASEEDFSESTEPTVSTSKEASFADIIRDQAVVTTSPYDSQSVAAQEETSGNSSDDIDLTNFL
jgi:hypothetical protein